MKHYLAITLLSIIICCSVTTAQNVINCNPKEYATLQGDRGLLSIVRNNTVCGFESKDETTLLILKTSDLKLIAGDRIEIQSEKDVNSNTTTYYPPFDIGFLVSGSSHPKIIFNFNKTDDTQMFVEYLQDPKYLVINGDMYSSQFIINPLNIKKYDIVFTKTVADFIHIEISGASIAGTTLNHLLLKEPSKTITIEFMSNKKVEIKTSIASAKCSNIYNDSKEDIHEITGPDSTINATYKCVSIFETSMTGQAHYEADFKNFLDLVDDDDRLILESSSNRVDIFKSGASDYTGQTLTFAGNQLVVIYESPRIIRPSKIQFKLSVLAKANGGIIDKAGPISFPSTGNQVRYLFAPDSQRYAAVVFSNNVRTQDMNITIFKGNNMIAQFAGDNRLPPIIVLDEPNTKMTLDISAKSFNKLANSVSFESLESSCHKIASASSGEFSVIGGQGKCYWTLASHDNVGLLFNYNDLHPDGCLTIQPLSQDQPLYTKCNLTRNDIIPPIILNQAYINVTLPSNGTRLDASIYTSPHIASTHYEPSNDTQVISSLGYPVSYAWSGDSQSYVIDGNRSNYLLSFFDIDIRTGEKFLVNNISIERSTNIDDMILSNITTAKIDVVRSPATTDFSLRRGFKLSAKRFDQILVADLSKKNITIPKNLTSLFVKISSSGGQGKFGKRILFNVSATNETFDLAIHDGRSTQAHIIAGNVNNGSTTSDTLLLSFSVNKPNATLPQLIIGYGTIDCNKTDHICDAYTRCVPVEKLCKGVSYCDDGSDLKLTCSSGPLPRPQIIETGVAGITVFILCILMLSLGAVFAIYGPDFYKTLENRFRSGQYTAFTSGD